jgi:excisionase family DNA binding protein
MKANENFDSRETLEHFLDFQQACTLLNLKPSKVRSLIFKKEIPLIRIGRLLRFERSALLNWIESKKEY